MVTLCNDKQKTAWAGTHPARGRSFRFGTEFNQLDYFASIVEDKDETDYSSKKVTKLLGTRSAVGAVFGEPGHGLIGLMLSRNIGLVEFTVTSIENKDLDEYVEKGISIDFRQAPIHAVLLDPTISDLVSMFGKRIKAVFGEYAQDFMLEDELTPLMKKIAGFQDMDEDGLLAAINSRNEGEGNGRLIQQRIAAIKKYPGIFEHESVSLSATDLVRNNIHKGKWDVGDINIEDFIIDIMSLQGSDLEAIWDLDADAPKVPKIKMTLQKMGVK